MKILIAVPTYENITPDTFKSIYELDKCGNDCIFDFIRGYACDAARNHIAERALELETDYVLMIDNDVILPQDALNNLLEGDNDVCLGYCARRLDELVSNPQTCIYKNDGEFSYTHNFLAKELITIKNACIKRIQIHGGGMACALIKTEVFRKLKFPWYKFVTYDDRGVLSEDLYFCEQCNQNNIPIYVDTRVNCKHLFRTFVSVE